MTFKQLVADVAADSGVTQVDARKVLASLATVVANNAKKNEDSPLPNLGTFTVAHRKQRNGTVPGTGKKIVIEAREVLTFRVAPSARAVKLLG